MSRFELSLSDGYPLSSKPRGNNANGDVVSRGRQRNGTDIAPGAESTTDGPSAKRNLERKQPSPLRLGAQRTPQHHSSPNHHKPSEPGSFNAQESSLALFGEDYTAKVKRKRRLKGCLNLSITSWLFLILAFIQGEQPATSLSHELEALCTVLCWPHSVGQS